MLRILFVFMFATSTAKAQNLEIDIGTLTSDQFQLFIHNYHGFNLTKVDTGNRFKVKRTNAEATERYTNRLRGEFKDTPLANVRFKISGVRTALGDYDFRTKSFGVCLPGVWHLQSGMLQMNDYPDATKGCKNWPAPIPGLTPGQMSTTFALKFESDVRAEQFFDFADGKTLKTYLECQPNNIQRDYVQCLITYIHMEFDDGTDVVEMFTRPGRKPAYSVYTFHHDFTYYFQ